MITTKSLITIIEGVKIPNVNMSSIIDKAHKNKVLLHTLRVLNFQGTLRESQESAIRRISTIVRVLSKLLEGYDYAFFKLAKPIAYVPADIDILVRIDHVGNVVKEIMRLGYRIVVKDPYCITLVKAGSIIDVYVHPSLGGIILLDGQRLLEYVSVKSFNGIEVRSLESYVEALVVAVHAIYKERMYTLNDYFVIEKWVSLKTYRLAQEFGCEGVLEVALGLNEKIRQGLLETPYKIPTLTWIMMLLRKFQSDDLTRATSVGVLRALANRHEVSALISLKTHQAFP